MSRYIDACKVNELYKQLKVKYGFSEDEVISEKDIVYFLLTAIDLAPTADVVSREQYNLCYDECLRLRSQNEQLLDALRSYEE